MIQSRREYAIIIDYSALAGEIFIKYVSFNLKLSY